METNIDRLEAILAVTKLQLNAVQRRMNVFSTPSLKKQFALIFQFGSPLLLQPVLLYIFWN